MVAALGDAIRTNQLHRVAGVISFLERYALEHFATEERHMAARGYPQLQEHRARHAGFVAELGRRKSAIAANGVQPDMVAELSDWLSSWQREHMGKMDREMGRFFRSTGPGRGATGQGPEPSE
jgi:hemerythrin-like metal-binding protein